MINLMETSKRVDARYMQLLRECPEGYVDDLHRGTVTWLAETGLLALVHPHDVNEGCRLLFSRAPLKGGWEFGAPVAIGTRDTGYRIVRLTLPTTLPWRTQQPLVFNFEEVRAGRTYYSRSDQLGDECSYFCVHAENNELYEYVVGCEPLPRSR